MLTGVEKLAFLRETPLFGQFKAEELYLISRVTREETFQSGESLIREGEIGDKMFIIVSGQVKVFKGHGAGREELAVLNKTDFLGEMAVFDEEPRSASADAIDEVVTLTLDRDDLVLLLAEFPRLALGFLKELSRRIRRMNEQLRGLTDRRTPTHH